MATPEQPQGSDPAEQGTGDPGIGDPARSEALIDALPDGVLVVDDEGTIVSANAAAETLFGYERNELVGASVESLVPSHLREEHRQHRARYLSDPQTRPMGTAQNLVAQHRNGEIFPVDISLSPISTGEGDRVVATIRRQRPEIARLSAIFESSHDGVYVVDPANERIVDVNPRACEMLGYEREELIGASPAVVHPHELESLRRFASEVMQRGTGQTSELSCKTKGGSLLDAEISASVARVGDSEALVTIVRDVTERRHMEQKLERLASLPRDNPHPVVELDLNGDVSYVNPKAAEVFPLLNRLGGDHPFCMGIMPLARRLAGEERRVTEREVEIGGATYSQTIALVSEAELVRIYAYDLTERKRAEELERELEVAETVRTATLDTIVRLSQAAEYRDEDTGAHIRRIAYYSAAIARRMQLDEETVELILHAAPMHDVGKIAIPDRILLKPGRLTEEEMETMKQHTVLGARLLSNSDSDLMRAAETIALTHHEKWDGTGYPHGKAEREIPTAGRVVAVADVYDALTSARPYKEAMAPERAISIMRQERARHFDPEVLDAFLSIQSEIASIAEHHSDHLADGLKGYTRSDVHNE
jgi:PAS domain S-box-containing protein